MNEPGSGAETRGSSDDGASDRHKSIARARDGYSTALFDGLFRLSLKNQS